MLPISDLDHCLDVAAVAWPRLKGARVFITGATGIIGKWLLETLLEADVRYSLGVSIVALSRDPAAFALRTPHLAKSEKIAFLQGDVREFTLPSDGFDVIIHAATDVVMPESPKSVFDTCIEGTRQVLRLTNAARPAYFLLLSSGAIYGPQPSDVLAMPECYRGGPDPLAINSAYAEGKRVSEWLCAVAAAENGYSLAVARVYALVGPYLPLNKHFAIGNFIADAMAGRPIEIRGDGTNCRSYLHLADTIGWLWVMLTNGGPTKAYNVGSSEGIALGDLALMVNSVLGSAAGVEIKGTPTPGKSIERYVPDVESAFTDLGLRRAISLENAIRRTATWHREMT
jgi:dTDP-glucose 4,6-dehydratase